MVSGQSPSSLPSISSQRELDTTLPVRRSQSPESVFTALQHQIQPFLAGARGLLRLLAPRYVCEYRGEPVLAPMGPRKCRNASS